MSVIYVALPVALLLAIVAVVAFVYQARSGQFDDLESHGWSVVLDDDQKPPATSEPANDTQNSEEKQ